MSTLGRISGSMLKANLERLGVDLAVENDLLYLDVVNGKVGINTDIAPRELTVDGTSVTTNLIVDSGLLQVADTTINGETGVISSVGSIPITIDSHSGNLIFTEVSINDLNFNNSTIQTTVTNSNLEIRTNGTGRIEFGTDDSSFTDVRITENLHASGDVTLDGDITFGDSSAEDRLSVYGKISSDILPSVTDLYNIGSPTEKWKEVHSRTINGEYLVTTNFGVPGITTISARPGNTWYVSSVEGDDTNVGDHQMGPFKTIKHALSQASSGDTVYLYAGNYEEFFPLTVPKGVTVQGESIRGVKVYPHTSNNDKDAFLLNGETTVENLTVSDFYYNSTNDTGYAFRFANNFQVDTRSPYVRNISVLTKSDSSFESAGRGALVDGSVATQYSKEASMLFHSVTFITPGSIALYMKNGVRVEWLNSFTYFASRGLYAQNGPFGRLTPDGSTIKYGAELRSIGSANVYGNVGAEADGNECLMYLIQHNFAYIGAGTDVENDPNLVTQNTETIEVNSGKIYYQSVDQDGDFRVGEAFTVDQSSGFITANGLGGNVGGITTVSFSDGINNTEIDASQVSTGNIQLTQNNINTVGGDLNVTPSSGQTTLDSDVDIEKSLTVDGDMVVNGAVSFGDSSQQGGGSQISFDAPISIDLEPTFDKSYNLGNETDSWKDIYTARYAGENIEVFQNRITTTISSSNLELEAAGTGIVQFLSPVEVANNLTFGNINFQDIDITGTLTHTGNTNLVGNKTVSGNYTLSGFLSLNDDLVPFDDIKIAGNKITTTKSNSSLELIANGTGKLYVENNNVQLGQDLTVGEITTTSDIISNSVTSEEFYTEGLYIHQNNIFATSNSDIELRTNSTTDILPLSITSTATISRFEFQPGSNYNSPDAFQPSVILQLDTAFWDISAQSFPQYLKGTNTVNGEYFLIKIDNPTPGAPGQYIYDVTQHVSSSSTSVTINQSDNFDLILGAVIIEVGGPIAPIVLDENVEITNDLTAITNSSLNFKDTSILGLFSVTGPINLTENSLVQGNFNLTGYIDTSALHLDNIKIDTNVITTTESNSDLELSANGTGKVITEERVTVENTIDIKGALDFQSLTAINSVSSQEFFTDQIKIRENYITTISSNGDLELRASGTGKIIVSETDVQIDTNLTVNKDTTLNDTSITGTLTHTGTRTESGTYTNNGNLIVSNDVSINGYLQGDNVRFETNYISSTESDSNLELRANGTGNVLVNDTNVNITESLTVVNDIFTTNATITNTLQFDRLEQNEIILDNNFITTSTSNTDLELRASGSGLVLVEDSVNVSENLNVTGTLYGNIVTANDTVSLNSVTHNSGTLTRNGTTTLSNALTVNDNVQFENIKIDDNVITTTESNSDLELRAAGTGEVLIDTDVTVNKNITVLGDTTLAGDFTVSSIVFNSISDGDILIDDNFITTTLSNSNLDLRANGAGIIYLDSNDIQVDENFTVNRITDLLDTDITGVLTHTGNATHNGNYTNNGEVLSTGNFVTQDNIKFSNIEILNNTVRTTVSNSDLEFRADGLGKVVFDNDTLLNLDLNVVGTFNSKDVIITGTIEAPTFQTSDDLRISGDTISTTVSNSNVHLRALTEVQTDNILFDENVIKSKQLNQDIVLKPAENLDVSTSGPQGYTASLPITGSMYLAAGADYSLTEDRLLGITSQDMRDWANSYNGQTVTIDLTGQSSGTAQITGTLVYTSGDSYLAVTPNTLPSGMTFQNYDVTGLTPNSATPGTTNFILPKGTTAQSTTIDGMIRFDTDLNKFTGHMAGVKPFGGVYSADRRTNVTVSESRFFKDNQTINFQNNNIQTGYIDSRGINVVGLTVDNLTFNSNTISSLNDSDINLLPNGTGDVILDDTIVRGSEFENQSATDPMTLATTQNGYVKFNSKTAVVVPSGTTAQQPSNPEVGEIRYNIESGSPEVYNGSVWATWAGQSVTATEDEIDEISNIFAILLG